MLEGKREFGDAIRVDEATGLHYLATARHEDNPQRLLMGRNMQNVITQALRHYDLIVIDAPPVLAAPTPWSGRYADASLLRSLDDSAGGPAAPQRLLMGREMQNVITQALRHYDLIVIDAPPVLAVSDALVLARYADASLLMVRWNKTSRKLVGDAIKRLRVSGVKVSGAVMTMVDLKKKARGGYDDYSYRNPYYTD